MSTPRPEPTSAEIDTVLASFGIARAEVRRQPSLSSTVYEVRSGREQAYLKRHPADAMAQVRWAAEASARLMAHGIPAPRTLPTSAGAPYLRREGDIFTLSPRISGRPLGGRDLAGTLPARRLGTFLARVHAALEVGPAAPVPHRSPPWDDRDHAGRLARARDEITLLPSARAGQAMLSALAALERMSEAQRSLECPPGALRVLHGDFWPGNVIAGASDLERLGVIDLEYSWRGPALVDVAHFADVGFRTRVAGRGPRIDLTRASAFARAYADGAGLAPSALSELPRVMIAARACSLLWILEQHLRLGPNPLDGLVADDVGVLGFLTSAGARWSERLAEAEPSTPSRRGRAQPEAVTS